MADQILKTPIKTVIPACWLRLQFSITEAPPIESTADRLRTAKPVYQEGRRRWQRRLFEDR